jgi:hypothetical protein
MAKIFTDEVKAQICAEYQDKSILSTDILKRYKLTSKQFREIIDEAGIPPRSPSAWGRKKDLNGRIIKNVCPKCKKELANKEARFCWYCGSDVRSEKQILIERLNKLAGLCDFIPAADRDEFIKTINDAVKELKK